MIDELNDNFLDLNNPELILIPGIFILLRMGMIRLTMNHTTCQAYAQETQIADVSTTVFRYRS